MAPELFLLGLTLANLATPNFLMHNNLRSMSCFSLFIVEGVLNEQIYCVTVYEFVHFYRLVQARVEASEPALLVPKGRVRS